MRIISKISLLPELPQPQSFEQLLQPLLLKSKNIRIIIHIKLLSSPQPNKAISLSFSDGFVLIRTVKYVGILPFITSSLQFMNNKPVVLQPINKIKAGSVYV